MWNKKLFEFDESLERLGIVFLPWRRLLPTSKLVRLESMISDAGLQKLVVVCKGISYNAGHYIERHNVPVSIWRIDEAEEAPPMKFQRIISAF